MNDNWMSWWELLKDFKEEKGHFPSTSQMYRRKHLGQWASMQWSLYKLQQNGEMDVGSVKMKEWQIAKMDERECNRKNETKKQLHDAAWLDWWELLKDFKEEKGHFPTESVVYHGKKLGKWVYAQRWLYRRLQNGDYRMVKENWAQSR
mmetsp:Transcript_11850/g.26308  ORF Transcript_11850/g.26308 Transcript_11850/m.26308 type:complete len:148 (+) Transcript_11850:618-1061(+)